MVVERAKCKEYSHFRPGSNSSVAEEDGLSNEDEEGKEGISQERTLREGGKGEDKEDGILEEEETEEKEEKERTAGPGSLSLTPDIVKGRGEEEEEDSNGPRTPGIATTSRLPDMLDHTPHSLGESDR